MLAARAGFQPRFAVEDIPVLAGEYRYADDSPAREAGKRAARSGYLTRDDLIAIGSWKTNNRQRENLKRNSEATVREVTGRALDPATPERQRLAILRTLDGVGAPVASAILHFVDPARWSILDYRILQALGVPKPSYYSLEFWESFQRASGELAADAGVDRRTFDKAGFVWSRIFGKSLGEVPDDAHPAPQQAQH